MKIVKFQNGEYGVRRWRVWLFLYEYLGLKNPQDDPDYWWTVAECIDKQCKGSMAEVDTALQTRKAFLKRPKQPRDYGRPLK